jgi:hypothetical protein
MRKSDRANIDAMLRHLASHHDPQDFPSTAYERQALIESAGKRRLIEWQKDRRRYELTPAGRRRLRRGAGLGFASLAIGAGVGATIGAAALAALWLPTDRSTGEHGAPVSLVANPGTPSPALPPARSPAPGAPPAVVPSTAPNVTPAATVVEQPAPAQPEAEPATSAAKDPVKKSRHKTARGVGHRNWSFPRRYRDERYAGSGRP